MIPAAHDSVKCVLTYTAPCLVSMPQCSLTKDPASRIVKADHRLVLSRGTKRIARGISSYTDCPHVVSFPMFCWRSASAHLIQMIQTSCFNRQKLCFHHLALVDALGSNGFSKLDSECGHNL